MSNTAVAVYNRINTLVGSDVEAVYAMSLPPDAVFPCVVYAQIYGGDGIKVSGGAGDTYRLRYQIDIYHSSFADLMDVRSEILAGFNRYASDDIHDTRIDMDIPYMSDDLDPTLPQLYRHIIDISVEVKRNSA